MASTRVGARRCAPGMRRPNPWSWQVPERTEAAGLPAQGAVPDAGEEVARGIEGLRIEVGDQDIRLLPPVLADRRDQVVAQLLDGGEIGDAPRAHLLRQGELGARAEPVGEMVPLGVIGVLRRHGAQLILKAVSSGLVHGRAVGSGR